MPTEKGQYQRQPRPKGPIVRIWISEKAVKEATKRDSSHCMVAESIRQSVENARNISVDLQTIRFSDPIKRLRYTYLTPRIVQVMLIRFDQGEKFEAFSFILRGAHVTAMMKQNKDKVPLPPNVYGERLKGMLRAREIRDLALKKTDLRYGETGGNAAVPRRVGGKPPPVMNFARRRAFGLRNLVQ